MNSIEELRQEARLRVADPLRAALGALTLRQAVKRGGAQWDFVESASPVRLLDGGNQSGKTWTHCVDFIASARGLHPVDRWAAPYAGAMWKGWYATVSFGLFAEQGWSHFKRLLLWPGESVLRLPTRAIVKIGWNEKNPETPAYVMVRRQGGGCSEIAIKSYEQGAGQFQTAEVDRLALDEEFSQSIWDEAQPRVARRRGRISISATPVLGVPILAQLRVDAEAHPERVCHVRLSVRDNPAVSAEAVLQEEFAFRGRPEIARLRLDGFPVAMEGLVYPDTIFSPDPVSGHVCEPFKVGNDWARWRSIDPGYRNFGCLWFAVAPGNRRVVCYRDYIGKEQTLAQNAAEIVRLSGSEAYNGTLIDPAALGTEAGSGRTVLDQLNHPKGCWLCGGPFQWRERPNWCRACDFESGLDAGTAPDNDVRAGIDAVAELLNQRIGPGGEWSLFAVFRSCTEFLRERREYQYRAVREQGDEPGDRVVKRDDHLMDPWRYFVAAGCKWTPPRRRPPPEGSTAALLQRDRAGHRKAGRR